MVYPLTIYFKSEKERDEFKMPAPTVAVVVAKKKK